MSHYADAAPAANERYYAGMLEARRKLVTPLVIIVLVFFFAQQVITNFTPWLDGMAFPGMSWAYIWAFAQFFLVVILTTVYRSSMQSTRNRLEAELNLAGPAAQEGSR